MMSVQSGWVGPWDTCRPHRSRRVPSYSQLPRVRRRTDMRAWITRSLVVREEPRSCWAGRRSCGSEV